MYKLSPEFVKSGEYFKEAKEWYAIKYVHPFSQRSFILILSIIICIIFTSVVMNTYRLFPSEIKVRYVINIPDTTNKSTQIYRADYLHQDANLSITHILITKYLLNRENYSYEDLTRQFTYIKTNSTRVVFRRFFNFMNIDNPDSPVLKYKKNANRKVEIISTEYPSPNHAILQFRAITEHIGADVQEDSVWEANIKFDIDKISANLPSGKRFNFTVTDYDLTLIKDNLKK